MKTNNYLRAIDRRLGNPTNTFAVINRVSWQVYKKDIGPKLSYWCYYREMFRYYILKFGLIAAYMGVRVKQILGYQVSSEELQDFELDVTLSDTPPEDSLMGLALSSAAVK
jgi:hypothetical protein